MTFINEVTRNISLNEIDIHEQIRSEFNETALKELAQSIKANGVIQSILVKPAGNNRYRLIAGERRVRASLLAGKSDIPARIVDVDENEILTVQIVENLQRQDISTMDYVRAFIRMRDELALSITEITKKLGKSSFTIDSFFRLSKTDPAVHEALENKQINRSVALVISNIEDHSRQRLAVSALKREKSSSHVSKTEAENWINRTFGVQSKRIHRHPQTHISSQGRFASDWKYYLIRFNAEQFLRWQTIVNLRTETEIFAQAVEQVMSEGKLAQST